MESGSMEVEVTLDYAPVEAAVLEAISAFLTSESSDSRPRESPEEGDASIFDACEPPSIPFKAYLMRLARYTDCSPECYVLAVVYALRTRERFTSKNIHRLMLAGLVIAAKWRDDFYFGHDYYSVVGGVSPAEMLRLELGLLEAMQWRTFVHLSEYEDVLSLCFLESPPAQSLCTARSESIHEWYEMNADGSIGIVDDPLGTSWAVVAERRTWGTGTVSRCWDSMVNWVGWST
eukprot:Hpha_TRINITY_DN15976_c2_g7::TRINITY_DN15976_c2_g7_i1::g.73997::m.73997